MKDDRLYLHHMLERCRRVTRFIASGRDAFMPSEEIQDAVIRNVEVIGEAAKRVSSQARGRLASLDWKAICGMRDVLIHDYIGRGPGRSMERRFGADSRTLGGIGESSRRRRRERRLSLKPRAVT